MMHPGGRGALVYVRHDYRAVFLGEDSIEALKATAEERLRRHRGAPLRVVFAGQPLELHGLGVMGAVAQVELAGRVLVLVLADHDKFELYLAGRTGECQAVGEYTAAELGTGDLGEIVVAGRTRPDAGRTDDGDGRPRRPPPHSHRASAPVPPRRTEAHRLMPDDMRQIAACLCPEHLRRPEPARHPYRACSPGFACSSRRASRTSFSGIGDPRPPERGRG